MTLVGRQMIRRTIRIIFILREHNITGCTSLQLSKLLKVTDILIFKDLLVMADEGVVERDYANLLRWRLTERMRNFSHPNVQNDN